MSVPGPPQHVEYAEALRSGNAEVLPEYGNHGYLVPATEQAGYHSAYSFKAPSSDTQPDFSAPIVAKVGKKQTCGMSRKLFWTIMIILVALVLIGVAVGVGVAVGTKKHGGSSTSLAAESATAGLSNNPSLSFTGTPTSSIQSSSSTSSPTSTSLSVLSAVYGASDVTDTAKSILPQKENIFIPTEPTLPFPDSWFGYRKCLALLLRYGSVDNQDLRTFIACEGTGNYTLVPGNVSLSPNTEATTNLGPSTSTFHIISVIWGPTEIRDSNIYQKLFDCASKSQAVSFSNEFFGQDTWNGTAKSAAVFYTTDNFSTVKNIFGREGQNASFSLL